MPAGSNRHVTIVERGREGQVIYSEDGRSIAGYQEFGGGDVVAIVSMGSEAEWRARHAWALDQRAQILRFIADEVIRQKAPGCAAEIDEARGDIVLRSTGVRAAANAAGTIHMGAAANAAGTIHMGAAGAAAATDHSWVSRFFELRGKLGLVLLVMAVIVGLAFWVKTRVFVVQGGKGTPMGNTLRTGTHLATLIQHLQPYTPSLHHDPSTERFTLSVFLVPLDGSATKLVRLARDLRPGSYSLARVVGGDARTMWIDVNGIRAVDLQSDDVLGEAPPPPAGDPLWMSTPPHTRYMAAGLRTPDGAWLGVHSQADLEKGFKPGRWLRVVESAEDVSRESRRLLRGELEPGESSTGGLRRIHSMTPISETEYRNAAFLRLDEKSEPLRVAGPDSVWMLHTAGARSTLHVARVELGGKLLDDLDTGIERFKLQQILPGEASTAFVGTRPPVPDQVSEPLLVILDHATGRLTTHSLWRAHE